jgi:predicted transcriptional regulator
MPSLRVWLDVPRDALSALDVDEDHLAPRLRTLLAVALVRERCLSTGKAAEWLGLSKAAFLPVLAQHRASYFSETPAELARQVERVGALLADEEESEGTEGEGAETEGAETEGAETEGL